MGPVGHGDSPLNVFKKNNLENVVSHSWFRVRLKGWFIWVDAQEHQTEIGDNLNTRSSQMGERVVSRGLFQAAMSQ